MKRPTRATVSAPRGWLTAPPALQRYNTPHCSNVTTRHPLDSRCSMQGLAGTCWQLDGRDRSESGHGNWRRAGGRPAFTWARLGCSSARRGNVTALRACSDLGTARTGYCTASRAPRLGHSNGQLTGASLLGRAGDAHSRGNAASAWSAGRGSTHWASTDESAQGWRASLGCAPPSAPLDTLCVGTVVMR